MLTTACGLPTTARNTCNHARNTPAAFQASPGHDYQDTEDSFLHQRTPMASDSGNGGGNSSQFLTSGSSALILAFLAIGLFVGGLLVMFAMRRYVVLSRRRAGVWEPAGAGPWNWEDTTYGMEPLFTITVGRSLQRRQERGFGARPELLDVHAVKAASDSWEDIMVSSHCRYVLSAGY